MLLLHQVARVVADGGEHAGEDGKVARRNPAHHARIDLDDPRNDLLLELAARNGEIDADRPAIARPGDAPDQLAPLEVVQRALPVPERVDVVRWRMVGQEGAKLSAEGLVRF